MDGNSDSRCRTQVFSAPPLATQQLKHFQLEHLLGQGGMGMVYRAFDSQLCRPVAIKVLPAQLTSDPERKQRFLLEARAAARINHPAVAQIYYADEQDNITFMAMELVEGKTLREKIQTGDLDLLGTVDIILQVAEGLSKAHELGIVHRDIKPANVMLTADGRVKILDFGLAKLLDRAPELSGGNPSSPLPPLATLEQSTLPGLVMGTAAYMSPEQVRGVAVDHRSDLFSVGVLLFEMATGQSPFQRENFMDSLHAIAFEDPPSLNTVRSPLPEQLQRIVSRCLRKSADERYQDAHSLIRDLRELRRNTEAGLTAKTDWRLRVTEAWERLWHLPPSRYAWFFLGVGGAAWALYLSFSRVGSGGVVFLTLAGLYLYRYIRNGPHKAQNWFVRQVAKVPEVRLITVQRRQFTVIVDRAVPQLYARINRYLQTANRRLYFGEPMTVSILPPPSPDKTEQLLSNPGVQYVREDALHH